MARAGSGRPSVLRPPLHLLHPSRSRHLLTDFDPVLDIVTGDVGQYAARLHDRIGALREPIHNQVIIGVTPDL